jgi:hypothetical protein
MKDGIDEVKDYDTMLQKHIDKRDLVTINRTFGGRPGNLSGFILNMAKDFLLIQLEEEFSLNGYAIIEKHQFDDLRCNKFDRTRKKILRAEGIFDKDYGIENNIDLSNWQSIFKDLKKFDYNVIIECEDLDEPTFEIGPIKRIGNNYVSIQYHDPSGLLENKLTAVKYAEITIVKFDDRYSTTYKKYMRTISSEK